MTSICAALLDGPSPLAAMLANVAPPGTPNSQHVGPDGASLGFAQPAGGRNSGLFADAASGWTWVGNARLDYRDELLLALHLPSTISDAALAYQAFLRLELNCLSRLHGDWQFAAWNSRTRRMIVARDPFGSAGLYYHHTPGRFACAGHIDGVLAVPTVPREVNWESLALSLSILANQSADTGFRGIHRLIAGHALEVTASTCRQIRYWDLHEPVEPLRGSTDDLQIQFEDTFRRAVETRVRSVLKPASTLSGGLDSGAVTATAARLLAGSGQRLGAFTSVPAHRPVGKFDPFRFLDEGPAAAAVAQWHPNIDHHLVSAADRCPVAAIQRTVVLTGAARATANAVWLLTIFEESQAYGHHAIFNGQGGNATLSWHGPPTWRNILKAKLLQLTGRSFRRRGAWQQFCLLRPSTINAQGLAPLLFEAEDQYREARDFRRFSLQATLNFSGFVWTSLAGAYGLQALDPTVDPRFIRLCQALPPHLFAGRQPARRAMEGLLPDVVRLNRRRGLQSADFVQRLQANQPAAMEALERFGRQPAVADVLDVPRLRRAVVDACSATDPRTRQSLTTQICCGLAGGFFLEHATASPQNLVSKSAA
jgi:asparagine synthase (glutamine-hydrolysing)